MTTFEHAMLGVNGVLAAGLHRTFGWQVAAIAGIAAISPDWDGLPIVFSVDLFDVAHRVWGHNIFACVILGLVIGTIDYRLDLVTRAARIVTSGLLLRVAESNLIVRNKFSSCGRRTWVMVAVLAALSQIPADMLFSGTATLSDWELQPFWPLSDQGWVFPMVPWGDPGVTVAFIIGMFAMARWTSSIQCIAGLTLIVVSAYIVVRGLVPV